MYSVKSASSLHSGHPSIERIGDPYGREHKKFQCKAKEATSPPTLQHKKIQQSNDSYYLCRGKQSGISENFHNQSHYVHSHDIGKLNKKIKAIKTALKIAQQHNQQLHCKIKENNQLFDDEKAKYKLEIQKYKSLYEILAEKYEQRNQEFKTYKKKLKKNEKQGSLRQIEEDQRRIQELEETKNQLRQLLTAQEVKLQHFQRQNNLLRQEIIANNRKVSELESKILSSSRADDRQKSKIKNLASSQIKKIQNLQHHIDLLTGEKQNTLREKQSILQRCQQMEREVERVVEQLQRERQMGKKVTKEAFELQGQIRELRAQLVETKQQHFRLQKQLETEIVRLKEQCQKTNEKYNQILTVSRNYMGLDKLREAKRLLKRTSHHSQRTYPSLTCHSQFSPIMNFQKAYYKKYCH